MTLDDFLDAMGELGYSRDGARRMVSVTSSTEDLMGAPYNLVGRDNGTWIVLQPDGRGGYRDAIIEPGDPFVGSSLDDALGFVLHDTKQRRDLYGR